MKLLCAEFFIMDDLFFFKGNKLNDARYSQTEIDDADMDIELVICSYSIETTTLKTKNNHHEFILQHPGRCVRI